MRFPWFLSVIGSVIRSDTIAVFTPNVVSGNSVRL